MKLTLIVLAVVNLVACTNGYTRFYTPVPGVTPEMTASKRAAPPPQIPLVEHSATVPESDIYGRIGYVPIGYSNFNSGRIESEQGAIEQGQKVGADLVVIVNPYYTGSMTSHVPVSTPTTSTSYSSGSATAFGSGGTATAFGNSTTSTYETSTSYVPMTVHRFDYGAVYFVKWSYIFGAKWRDLTNEERAALQSNRGVFIESVVNDTPAFRNDVLPGDILLSIDGASIYGRQAASDMLTQTRGQKVEVILYRKGENIGKKLRLGQ